MMSIKDKLTEIFFESPQRRKMGVFYFVGAAGFLSMYTFLNRSLFTLTMFSGFLLTGLSEYLPEERNILSGTLRIAAILVYVSALVLSALEPEILF